MKAHYSLATRPVVDEASGDLLGVVSIQTTSVGVKRKFAASGEASVVLSRVDGVACWVVRGGAVT